ncbi:NAD kinase 2, mitochondrial isoform 1-T1 [Glossina fuscipes fuscipes]
MRTEKNMFKTKNFLQLIAKELLSIRRSSGIIVAPTVSLEPSKFKLRRALIITKLSRYEFEQSRYPELNEEQFHQVMRKRGTDLDAWIYHHKLHKSFEDNIVKCFQDAGCEVKMTSRAEFRSSLSKEVMNWADVIVPIGGDGTFLLAAGRASPLFAQSHTKIPIVGFNSDPQRSAGRLLLPKHYSDYPAEAVAKIKAGDFKWMHRTRIRSTILGINGKIPQSYDLYRHCISKMEQKTTRPETLDKELAKKYDAKVKRVLPYLALNEVFIGETLSSRVTHLQLTLDHGNVLYKTKSSGLCVSTGTGSTSWHSSINRITRPSVDGLSKILPEKVRNDFNGLDKDELVRKYNESLIFPADDPRICYSIREQINVGVWPSPEEFEPRQFVTNLYVKSCCFDANLVIDGSICYSFNDGSKVLLEVHPEDALLAITLD